MFNKRWNYLVGDLRIVETILTAINLDDGFEIPTSSIDNFVDDQLPTLTDA